MAGIYRPRHPERTVLYRVLFHYFDRFLAEYESRFEKEYGFFRPIIKEVVDRYLDCGNPRCGFARLRCPDCHAERLLMFSCRTRGFCPSCHAKRLEEWGEWMREALLLDVPHRQVVFTIPRMPRPIPAKGWAEMIRKVYEVDPMLCPECSSDYVCFS
jgi:ribosomal protein S27E